MAENAFGTEVLWSKAGDGSDWALINGVQDVSGPSTSRDATDSQHHQLPGGWKSARGGTKDPGELSFTLEFDAADPVHVDLLSDYSSCEPSLWMLRLPACGAVPGMTWLAHGLITAIAPNNPVSGVQTSDITVKLSGAPMTLTRRREAGGATGCIGAWSPTHAPNLGMSLVDLSGTGNSLVAPVPPVVSAKNGWTFTGTEYLTSQVVAKLDYSVIVSFANVTDPDVVLFGAEDSVNSQWFFIRPNVGGEVQYAAGDGLLVAPNVETGVLAIAGGQGFRGGVKDGDIPPGNGAPIYTMYVGAGNRDGSMVYPVTGDIMAIAFYDHSLSAAQVMAITAAMPK